MTFRIGVCVCSELPETLRLCEPGRFNAGAGSTALESCPEAKLELRSMPSDAVRGGKAIGSWSISSCKQLNSILDLVRWVSLTQRRLIHGMASATAAVGAGGARRREAGEDGRPGTGGGEPGWLYEADLQLARDDRTGEARRNLALLGPSERALTGRWRCGGSESGTRSGSRS